MTRRNRIDIATPAETELFETIDWISHSEAAKTILRWETLERKDTFFYLPVEKNQMADGTVRNQLYMEPPREHEVWLSGIIAAFMEVEDLNKYISHICDRRDVDESHFTAWKTNLDNMCSHMPKVLKQWNTKEPGGIRIELFQAVDEITFRCIDILWDSNTN